MEGAHERFAELYERAYLPVLKYARRRAEADVAGDVVSEVFVVAWRRLSDVPDADPLPWLYAVARRVLANQRRGADRGIRLAERVAASARNGLGSADPAETVTAGLSVAAAFGRLSPADREVLALAVWEELSPRDTARVLGCSTAAVATRLSRARRRFRTNLITHGHEEN